MNGNKKQTRRVYLDKFVTLPHLPSSPGAGPGFNKRMDYLSPNLDHTGIRTAFQGRVERPVKPNGRLTPQYVQSASKRVAGPSRTLVRIDKKRIRSHFEKSAIYEERLLGLEQKRNALVKVCDQQVAFEKSFLPPESIEGASVVSSLSRQSKKSSQRGFSESTRPRRIVNQDGLVKCLLDTSDISICSSEMLSLDQQNPPKSSGESLGRNSIGMPGGTYSLESKNAGRWSPEALSLAHGSEWEEQSSVMC